MAALVATGRSSQLPVHLRSSLKAGLTPEESDRLSSPIGLDLGARTPEETAISIAAEIVALQWGGSGDRLAARDGRIHH